MDELARIVKMLYFFAKKKVGVCLLIQFLKINDF